MTYCSRIKIQFFGALIFIVLLECELIKSDSDYKLFLDSDFSHLPKCCPPNFALAWNANNKTISCSKDELKFTHYEISATNIATNGRDFNKYCSNLECVDFINQNNKWRFVQVQNCSISTTYKNYTYFPKCCPNNFVYDALNHSCVNSSANAYYFGGSLQVINVSLAHCSEGVAITDFQDDFTIHESDKSLNIGQYSIEYKSYCIDKQQNNAKEIVRACLPHAEVCNTMKRRCLRKCCPDGEIYIIRGKKGSCSPHYTAPFNVTQNERFKPSDTDYGIIIAGPGNKYIAQKEHKFYIDEIGYFHTVNNEQWITLNQTEAYYCSDSFLTPKAEIASYVFLTFASNTMTTYRNQKYFIQGCILAVSSIFMFITGLCYMFVPVLQNLHGRCILMYCIFMWIGDATLSYVQLTPRPDSYQTCVFLGFAIIFTFLGAFAWMNVVCFDMWVAFGTVKIVHANKNKRDLKKFLFYNLYGWGVPIIISGLTLLVFATECMPKAFVPHIGVLSCYFDKKDGTYDYILYFMLPLAMMLLINIAFFIKTAMYCYRVKKEIQRMQCTTGTNAKRKRFLDDKETLGMLFKIFLVMGIPWTFEFISSGIDFHDSSATLIIEAVGDFVNAAQGIIIFCILILKRRVYISIKCKLGLASMPSFLQTNTSVTRVSRNSRSNRESTETSKV